MVWLVVATSESGAAENVNKWAQVILTLSLPLNTGQKSCVRIWSQKVPSITTYKGSLWGKTAAFLDASSSGDL